MRRLLVIGASGFLGVHIAEFAVAAGWRVAAVARDEGLVRKFLGGSGAETGSFDLERGDADALIRSTAPDVLINAAALARPGDCEDDPERAFRVNDRGPGHLSRACAGAGVQFVHISTDLVFGKRRPPEGGFGELDEPAPMHAYGRTKLGGEQRARLENPRSLVVRLPLLFGDSKGRGLGASDSLIAARKRGDTVRLFTDEWRTPLDVESAAQALVELGGTPELAAGLPGGLLHVAGPSRVSRYEFGVGWLESLGEAQRESGSLVPCLQAELGLVPPRPNDTSLNAALARSLLRTPLRGAPRLDGSGPQG